MSKYIKHFLPVMWSTMGFTLACVVIFLPVETDRMTLIANTTSGLFGAAFGATNLNKDEDGKV